MWFPLYDGIIYKAPFSMGQQMIEIQGRGDMVGA